jgi:hypothetical protein
MTRGLKSILPILAALLLLLLISLAGRFFWRGIWVFDSKPEAREGVMEITRLPPSDCDLNRESCRIELPGGGMLTAELSPRPLAALQPLTARLTLQGIPAEKVLLTFSGVNMDMLFDPAPLQESAPGQFIGQAALPICVTGPMRWRAEFSITRQHRQLIAEFLFDSQ